MDNRIPGWIPVHQAAEVLHVSRDQVRDLVNAGALEGIKPGRELLVSSESVAHRAASSPGPGRPLSLSSAWAVLWTVSGDIPRWASSSERVRIRRYAARPLSQWSRLLVNRAQVHRVRVPQPLINRVGSLSEVVRGGESAAQAHGANLMLTGAARHEFYLSPAVLQTIRGMKGIGWQTPNPNVLLRVVPAAAPAEVRSGLSTLATVPAAVAAADLLDLGDDRSRRAAAELLGRDD